MDDESRRSLEREAMAGGRAEREAFTRAVLASGRGRVLAWVPDDPAHAPPKVGEVRARATVGSGASAASGVVLAVAVADLDDMTYVASRIAHQLVLVVLEEGLGYVGFGSPPWAVWVAGPHEGDEATGIYGVLPHSLREALGGAVNLVSGAPPVIQLETTQFPGGGAPAFVVPQGPSLSDPVRADAVWIGDPLPRGEGMTTGTVAGSAPGAYVGTSGWVWP